MNTDPTLTTEEQAAIDEGVADDAAALEAAAAEPVVAAVAEPIVEAKPDPVLTAIADQAAATRALADQIAADRVAALEAAKPAPVEEAAPVVRDFDAEHAALAQQFDDGDLDTAEHAKLLRRLTRDEAIAISETAIAAARQQTVAEQQAAADKAAADAKAADDANWKAASDAFLADPSNAALIDSPMKKGAFTGAMQEVRDEHPGIAYADLLVKTREKVTGVAAIDTSKTLKDAAFERRQDAAADAPLTLRDVPNAGNPAGADPGAALDNLPIDKLEEAMARMSTTDRNRYLAGAPGNQ